MTELELFSAPLMVLRGGDEGLLLSLPTLLRPLLILLSQFARCRFFSFSLIVGMLVPEGILEVVGREEGAIEKEFLGEVMLGLSMLLTLAVEFHSEVALV